MTHSHAEGLLRELLATIYDDGGYQAERLGLVEATYAAIKIVSRLLAESLEVVPGPAPTTKDVAMKRAIIAPGDVRQPTGRALVLCPHCKLARRAPGGGSVFDPADVRAILAGEKSTVRECQYCGRRYSLHIEDVDRVWPL